MRGDWTRVNRRSKCPVCGHDTWCLINHEAILCMRAVSDHPVRMKSGETGYIHSLTSGTGTRPMLKLEPDPEPVINCSQLMHGWTWGTKEAELKVFADQLGVSPRSLYALGCAWAREYRAFAFPMEDGLGNIVGIRLRSLAGRKWAVRGSHQGIFVPRCLPHRTIMICEGPTDAAAGITMGYWTVGLPSCSGGMDAVRRLVKRTHAQRAIIVSDNDDPGVNGAAMVGKHSGIPFVIWVPPAKDLREYVRSGGTKEMTESFIKGQIWQNTH